MRLPCWEATSEGMAGMTEAAAQGLLEAAQKLIHMGSQRISVSSLIIWGLLRGPIDAAITETEIQETSA